MKEIWKDIVGFEGRYQISNLGRVKSLPRVKMNINGKDVMSKEKILKHSVDTIGYHKVDLYTDSKRTSMRIHRLVAEAFIPNPDNKPVVDHIDTDKTNNAVTNLRWCTLKENSNNPMSVEKIRKINKGKSTTKRKVRCKTTGLEFESITEATLKYKISNTCIYNACRGKQKTAGQLKDGTRLEWEYIN